ncbi:MAG: VWA-like domain-containing protein, partial [Gammaproteobacteria bacterium]|nr:VWA-like domain-containing protein [Gammaproteobacteria bacterium]
VVHEDSKSADSKLSGKVILPKKFSGGGGTSFIHPFAWIETLDLLPDMLIYFTDAKGEFPNQAPRFPVLWLVKGKEPVPWGTRIQLN